MRGPGESGKSTIFKQMKILQDGGGFSTDELQSYKYIVYGNCVTQMKVIVNAVMKFNIALDSEENRVTLSFVSLSNVDIMTEEGGKIK